MPVFSIRLNEKQAAILNARAESECRRPGDIIKSAALFYAKYGPWALNRAEMDTGTLMLKPMKKMKLLPDFGDYK
jgi:hypothetical protein